MKKILALLFLIVLAASFSVCGITAYAEAADGDILPAAEKTEEIVNLTGAELPEGYSARLGYSYLQPASGGVFLKFDLIFAKGFLTESNLKDAENAVSGVADYFKDTRFKTEKTESGIRATASFSSPTDYYAAMGYSGNDKPPKDDNVYHYRWFFVDIEIPVKNPLKGSKIISDLEKKISALNIEKTQYAYTYSTRYKTIETEGVLKKEGDTYVHTFYMDKDTMPDFFIFKQRVPNTSGWYILALLGAFTVGITITAVAMRKYGKKRN